jgi:hypothetical protein
LHYLDPKINEATFFKEASHIWKALSGDIKADKLNFDLEINVFT